MDTSNKVLPLFLIRSDENTKCILQTNYILWLPYEWGNYTSTSKRMLGENKPWLQRKVSGGFGIHLEDTESIIMQMNIFLHIIYNLQTKPVCIPSVLPQLLTLHLERRIHIKCIMTTTVVWWGSTGDVSSIVKFKCITREWY